MNDDKVRTLSSEEQKETEVAVMRCFQQALTESKDPSNPEFILYKEAHARWLGCSLESLPGCFAMLDASRPWFVFWITHALSLLDKLDRVKVGARVISFLSHCRNPDGGFGGGPQQISHLATTYAAVASLVIIGTDEALEVVDRPKLYQFLMSRKHGCGGFTVHREGEIDMRGAYCALAVASMLHMVTSELTAGVAEYIVGCQTFEGGIAGERELEAHGGYSYCGLAALAIIGEAGKLDLDLYLRWLVQRQMNFEGGFQGRANKLVDSCYSFWQGASFPLLREIFRQMHKPIPPTNKNMYWCAPDPLQMYVLLSCQRLPQGGLRDKVGKSPDFYHSCYSLSGMAALQWGAGADAKPDYVLGPHSSNLLQKTNVFYNVRMDAVENARNYFRRRPQAEGEEQWGEGVGVILADSGKTF